MLGGNEVNLSIILFPSSFTLKGRKQPVMPFFFFSLICILKNGKKSIKIRHGEKVTHDGGILFGTYFHHKKIILLMQNKTEKAFLKFLAN